MMLKLKEVYRRMSLREKILLNAFLWVIVFIWFIFSLDGIQTEWKSWSTWSRNLQEQRDWLQLKTTVDSQLQESLQRFNPESTFDSASLVGRVDALARETGVSHDISTPRTQQGDQFEFHTLRVTLRRTPMEKWLAFDARLRAESPYINLESVRLSADSRDPTQFSGQFILKSFELKDSSNP